ncbi:MAG TPA: NlpC/P60 family protein [Parachlamydiaceae bacterium]|nr:NlpC/P60 family protein [Parachlamydiaceae bacterium]
MSFQEFYSIISPTLPMRKAPDCKSEVVSEGLFSESVHVLEEKGEWAYIKSLIDNYMGWVNKDGICLKKLPSDGVDVGVIDDGVVIVTTNRLAAHLYESPDIVYGPVITLPFESRLEVIDFKDDDSRWLEVLLPDARNAYVQRGDVKVYSSRMDFEQLCAFSRNFLGLPYTWGGRSSFGYDCSGFVQMLYRQMDVFLPRDSKDQFVCSKFRDKAVLELLAGDLIFFGSSEDPIRHVGMSLGGGRFIHTSAVAENMPFLRISNVSDPAWNGAGYYPFIAGRSPISS